MTVSIFALLSLYLHYCQHITLSLSQMSRGMGLFCQAGMMITNTDTSPPPELSSGQWPQLGTLHTEFTLSLVMVCQHYLPNYRSVLFSLHYNASLFTEHIVS